MTHPNQHKIDQAKERFLNLIPDMISDLLYYERKNDDELNTLDVKILIEEGFVTYNEIVKKFKQELSLALLSNFNGYYEWCDSQGGQHLIKIKE